MTNTPDYSDIIDLPRPTSKNHPPLSIDARAAQFAPYAALVGHKDIIQANETSARQKVDLDREITLIPDSQELNAIGPDLD